MTTARSAYTGETIVFATMHHKEALATPAFADRLGADVIAPDQLDTDQFGTFAGDIPRILSPLAAATVKARLGMHVTGRSFGMASEGSFIPTLIGQRNTEILLFIDELRGLRIIEQSSELSPLPSGRTVHNVGDAIHYAETIHFPEQGLTLQARSDDAVLTHKDITSPDSLADLVAGGLRAGMRLTLMPDHRAHQSPARARHIQALCDRMADRLATTCPTCRTPGYGLVDTEAGLLCSLCENPTAAIVADILGCGACDHQHRLPRPETRANPATCDYCNP